MRGAARCARACGDQTGKNWILFLPLSHYSLSRRISALRPGNYLPMNNLPIGSDRAVVRPFQRFSIQSLLASTLALLSSVFALGCSSKSSESTVKSCPSQVACGSACCATGESCGANSTCISRCASSNDCAAGQSCGSSGQCVGVVGAGGTGQPPGTINTGNVDPDGGGISQPTGDACVKLNVTFTPQIPTVVLLVDQSGSMNERFDTGNRWNVLRDALTGPTSGLIPTLQTKVRFGLALYTSDGGFGDVEPKKACPVITDVPPALNNLAAISVKYLPDDYKGDTPTGESVDAVVKTLSAVTDPGPKVIVLATDGEPDTCADHNNDAPGSAVAAQQLSVTAVQNAFASHITTFVISVGNEVGEAHLRAVANAGQGLAVDVDTTPRFFRANSQMDLKTAFDTIVNGVRSCSLELNGNVDSTAAGTGTVTLDGKPLSYAAADGWKLTSATTLELQGAACDAIKNGDHALTIDFPCGVIVPK